MQSFGLSPVSTIDAGHIRSPGMSLIQSLIHIYKAKTHSFTNSFKCSPICTSSIEVIHSIICDDYISFVHHLVMPDMVLLQSLGVQDSDLHQPHTRDGMQDYLITPEILPEQQA